MLLVYFSNPCIFVVTVSQNSEVTLGDKMIVLNSSLWVSRHSFGLLQKYTKSMWSGESREHEHMSTTFLVSRALHLHRAQPSWCKHRVCTTCLTRGKIKSDWFVIWFKWSTEDKLTRDITPPEADCQAPFLPEMDVVVFPPVCGRDGPQLARAGPELRSTNTSSAATSQLHFKEWHYNWRRCFTQHLQPNKNVPRI